MKKIMSLLMLSLLISGCGTEQSNSTSNSTNSNINNNVISYTTITKSPNEDGGLEGNAEEDLVRPQNNEILKNLFIKASTVKYYSYEITSTVSGSETHFFNYFTPYAWYEENDNPALSFGYAEEVETGEVFKYYLNEDATEVIPSIYEYTNYNNNITKLLTLYSPLAITHINLLAENMEDFSATSIGYNKFLITDPNIASIFQYKTTFGFSIINYINSTYIEIIDYDNTIFKAVCDLGQYGKIEGIFRPDNNLKIKFVNDLLIKGEIEGVEYHQDVYDFLNVKMNTNNFVLHGIKQPNFSLHPYTIHCTNDYFYLEYDKINYPNYTNYGFTLIPKGEEVIYYEEDDNGNLIKKTQTLNYTSCYKFKEKEDGSFYFSDFIGPLETNGLKYIEVDSLPLEGQQNILYILDVNGTKIAYEYRQNSEGTYSYFEYSTWFDSVGDFYINDSIATFYLSGTPLSSIGAHYFEKSMENENEYYSKDSTIIGALAHSLFGWGFQASNTWMDYIKNSKIRINKDSNNNITSYDVCLDVLATFNEAIGLHEISYTIDSFGEGNVEKIETFINENIGGA